MPATHDPDHHRCLFPTPHGDAELVYRIRRDGVMDLLHTFVPEAARGGTIASDLVKSAIAHATANGLKLKATCPYVQSWLVRHPETRELFVD
ncbi:MAG TPA: GNAT family N-acetyltransferase [Gemmatimonadales bacterium]